MSTGQATILQTILQRKQQEVEAAQAQLRLAELSALAQDQPPCRGFTASLTAAVAAGQCGIIAEIKKASPSKGVIREEFNPSELARTYQQAGANCLSVLTDRDFFQGAPEYLQHARDACTLPLLRKDFVIDEYQIVEARTLGADCVLLIAAAFEVQDKLAELYALATDLGMDVLIEVHTELELEQVLALNLSMIGINNRDLHSFDTSLQTTLNLLKHIPEDCLIVTESGIHHQADVQLMQANNVNCFLVGEAFMRANNPGEALQQVFTDRRP